jgi:hypothetical protein
MAERVVLFLDYQNVYRSSRETFHPLTAPHWYGQIDPLGLGELLIQRSPFEREFLGVRIYRGIPDSTKDSKGYGASQRQVAAWSQSPKVQVITRTLRYPFAQDGQEDGHEVHPERTGGDLDPFPT